MRYQYDVRCTEGRMRHTGGRKVTGEGEQAGEGEARSHPGCGRRRTRRRTGSRAMMRAHAALQLLRRMHT